VIFVVVDVGRNEELVALRIYIRKVLRALVAREFIERGDPGVVC
jgi:hypothetical protein